MHKTVRREKITPQDQRCFNIKMQKTNDNYFWLRDLHLLCPWFSIWYLKHQSLTSNGKALPFGTSGTKLAIWPFRLKVGASQSLPGSPSTYSPPSRMGVLWIIWITWCLDTKLHILLAIYIIPWGNGNYPKVLFLIYIYKKCEALIFHDNLWRPTCPLLLQIFLDLNRIRKTSDYQNNLFWYSVHIAL